MAFKKEKTEEQSHYYAGQKKGLWWKYLLAVIIILIYLLPLYVLLMQSFKSSTDLSSSMSVPDVWYFENYISAINIILSEIISLFDHKITHYVRA